MPVVEDRSKPAKKEGLVDSCKEFVKRMKKMRAEMKQKVLLRHKKLEQKMLKDIEMMS